MPKTISSTFTASGHTLSGASLRSLNPVTVTGSIDLGAGTGLAALDGLAPSLGSGPWTVTEFGTITGGTVAGIDLGAGGTVANVAPGRLAGHFGVRSSRVQAR